MKEIFEYSRRYASYDEWPDQQVKERSILNQWITIQYSEEDCPFLRVESPEQDPPDCIAVTKTGESVGFELTEFVDSSTIVDFEKNKPGWNFKLYSKDEFLSKLFGIIKEKNLKSGKSEEHANYGLLIHSDEPLSKEEIEEWLLGIDLPECDRLDFVYMILSPTPFFNNESDEYKRRNNRPVVTIKTSEQVT